MRGPLLLGVIYVVVALFASGAGGAAVGLWEFEDTPCDDDFAGNSLNTERWVDGLGAYGTINDALIFSSVVPFASSIDSGGKWALTGDFDVQIDFTNYSSYAGGAVQMMFTEQAGTDGYRIARSSIDAASEVYVLEAVVGGTSYGSVSTTADTSGRLRLVRSGSNVYGYYWSGASWSSIGSQTGVTQASVDSSLVAFGVGTGRPFTCAFDRFQVNKGERAADTSGQAHHGTVDGAIWSAGHSGNAISFDGYNDCVEIPDSSDFNFGSGSFAVSVWVKADGGGGLECAAVQKGKDVPYGLQLGRDAAGNAVARMGVGGDAGWDYVLGGSTDIGDGNWHMLTLSRDSDTQTVTLYVDGVSDDTTSASGNLNSDEKGFWLGKGAPASDYWDGGIDEIAVWDRYLDHNEVQVVHMVGSDSYDSIHDGLETFGLHSYTSEDLKRLATMYHNQIGTLQRIGEIEWRYLEELPGQAGHEVGDAYVYEGKFYIYLDSGLEGIPEPTTASVLGLGVLFMLRRKRR